MFVCQGDVGIKKIDKLPDGLKEVPADNNRNILAYGKQTGHTHALPTQSTKLYDNNDNSRLYLVVESPSYVTHEEHDPIELDAGVYEVIRQREYDDKNEWRLVAD